MTSRIVFWQNIPSIHQAPLLREVARKWPGEVFVIAEQDVSRARLAHGWTRPDFSPARLFVRPTVTERTDLIRAVAPGDVHIFSGFHAYPETYDALKQVSRSAATIGIFAEPPCDSGGLKAMLRKALYRSQAIRWRQRVDFVVATGELGVRYFAARGLPNDRIFPFGYFVDHLAPSCAARPIQYLGYRAAGRSRILFVGGLIPRKGLDLLLVALSTFDPAHWQLDVFGDGGERSRLRALAQTLGITEHVRWLGVRPNDEVRLHMAQADALVLPSRHDGWGAVVNEALMAGMRVIVSSASGSSDLVRERWRGGIFASDSIESLTAELQAILSDGPLAGVERARIRRWAAESIAPGVAAQYLIDVVEHVRGRTPRPCVPWRRQQAGASLADAQAEA